MTGSLCNHTQNKPLPRSTFCEFAEPTVAVATQKLGEGVYMAMSCAGWARKLVLGGGRGSANSFFRCVRIYFKCYKLISKNQVGGGSQGQERFFSYLCSRDWFFSHFFQHIPGQWKRTECFIFPRTLTEVFFPIFFNISRANGGVPGVLFFHLHTCNKRKVMKKWVFRPKFTRGLFPRGFLHKHGRSKGTLFHPSWRAYFDCLLG